MKLLPKYFSPVGRRCSPKWKECSEQELHQGVFTKVSCQKLKGKNYKRTKSLRSNNLTSFLIKTLENVINKQKIHFQGIFTQTDDMSIFYNISAY